MGPRDLNLLQLEGRLPKEPNQSCYTKKNVLPVGKTDLTKTEAIRITLYNSKLPCLLKTGLYSYVEVA